MTFPDKLKVVIKRKDITKGKCSSPSECALALAVERAVKALPGARTTTVSVPPDGRLSVGTGYDVGYDIAYYRMHDRAVRFVRAFDSAFEKNDRSVATNKLSRLATKAPITFYLTKDVD